MNTTVVTPRSTDIRISDWKEHTKNSLRGFFTAILPSGLVLKHCMLHERNGSRWVTFSSREWTNAAGERKFDPIVEFTSRDVSDRFRDACLVAIDKHLAGGDQ